MEMKTYKSYKPSNSSEGAAFEAFFCEECAYQDVCDIAFKALTTDIGEPGYPPEWVTGPDGPECTAFVMDATQEPEGEAPLPEVPKKFEQDAFNPKQLKLF